jgi:hypothetical protein
MRRQNDLAIGGRVVGSPDDIREACHRASNGNRPRSRRPDFTYEQKWRPIEQMLRRAGCPRPRRFGAFGVGAAKNSCEMGSKLA